MPLIRSNLSAATRWITSLFRYPALALTAATVMAAPPAVATANVTIEGVVTSAATGEPIKRARVQIKSGNQTIVTDDLGQFELRAAASQSTQIEVSYLGFEPEVATIFTPAEGTVSQNFSLLLQRNAGDLDGDVVHLEKFSVVADQTMTGQAVAMNEQRRAANIKSVVAFDELGDQGQENIGDYLRFLPGVAIMADGENPGTISLGGFPAEMSNIQVDGADLAGTGIGTDNGRTIALQDVPIVNIERIEVTKVPTPDSPASGLGGSMNVVTKPRIGLKNPIGTYQVYMNFNNIDGLSFNRGATQPVERLSNKRNQPSFGATYAFPVGDRIAISLGASRSWRQRPTDDTPSEVAFWNLRGNYLVGGAPKDYALSITQWRQEAEISITENLQAGVDWKISKSDTLSFGVQRRDITSKKSTSYMTTRINLNYDAIGGADTTQSRGATGRVEMGSNNPLHYDTTTENNLYTLQYRHRSYNWNIDAKASYSQATRERSSLGKGYFAGTMANIDRLNIRGEGINSGASITPETYTISTATNTSVNLYDGDSYNLINATEEYARYQTDLLGGRVDVTRTLNPHFTMKVGAAYNQLEKDDTRPNKAYTFRGANLNAVKDYDLIDESIDAQVKGNPVRWISPVKAYQLFVDNPSWFTLNSSAYQNEAQNSKRMIEAISAGYARFDLHFLGNRLNFAGGVRYEKTDLEGWSLKKDTFAIYQRDANGNFLRNASGGLILITSNANEQNKLIYQTRANYETQSYDGYYPSLNVNYAFSENLVARAAYARTIGRPDVRYVVAGLTLPTPTDTNATTARTIVVGNPGLEPWTADSLHLSLDSYHLKGGFGSIGVYRKNVSNFFAQRGMPVSADILRGYGITEEDITHMLNDNYVLRRWENVGDATLDGFEMSYRQDLNFLPPWLQLMQVWVNYTHLKVSGPQSDDFTGFSPDAFSAGVNYIRNRFSVRFNVAYQAETKRSLVVMTPGTSTEGFIPPATYEYQSASTRYGISAEYAFTKKFSAYMNWANINAEDMYVYRRAADTPGYAQRAQRYVTPSYIVIGIKGRF
jgi:iron complex outermembrane receptor protein